MSQPRPVLVGCDFSGFSRFAVERARRLAAEQGSDCVVVHVVSDAALHELAKLAGDSGAATRERILAGAADRLAEFVGHRASAGAGVELRVEIGPVIETLAAQAEALDARLVVVGARGEDFLRQLLIGTTAERLLRRLARPVLVVRQMPHEAYGRAMVGVDFSSASAAALGRARAVAPGAALLLVNAYEVPFEGRLRLAGVAESNIAAYCRRAESEARARLGELAAASGLPGAGVQLLVGRGDPSRVLLERAQEEGCDLLVVGKRGATLVEELLLGRVTKHVLAEATNDVLVVPPG